MRLWLVVLLLNIVGVVRGDEHPAEPRRDDFPRDFVFGSGTSAYQVEGAAAEDGRTPSVWDTFAHKGTSNGDVAADEYHKYKEDVKLMDDVGLEGYRLSISWSRLIPNGRGDVNPKGLDYYNNLIDELIHHGIQPHVTLFHYDLPQILEDEYQGWLSPRIVDDFTAYADVCFREFGDRVSHWTTLNEPNVMAAGGYDTGELPPGRCSYPFGYNCSHGDSVYEPYIVVHNCLLAHSSVFTLYKRKYQAQQQGSVGINIFTYHFVPKTDAMEDVIATKRAQDFYAGWIMQPLVNGDYPETMKKFVSNKLPKFSKNQSRELVGAFDFVGLNYYNTLAVRDKTSNITQDKRDYLNDILADISVINREESGTKILMPYGLQGVLEYIKQNYGNPPIYIQENGYVLPHNNDTVDDNPRVRYLSAHIGSLLNAIRNGSITLGYFTWSFLDAFELLDGYQSSYGMVYIDFDDKELKRYPKLSAHWYSSFLKRKENVIGENNSSLTSSSFYM